MGRRRISGAQESVGDVKLSSSVRESSIPTGRGTAREGRVAGDAEQNDGWHFRWSS